MSIQTKVAPTAALRPILKKRLPQIEALCRTNHVRRLWVFGSATTADFRRNSDLDFLVEIEPLNYEDYADAYLNLLEKLQDLFNREIDLVSVKSVHSPVFKRNVDAQKQLIYG